MRREEPFADEVSLSKSQMEMQAEMVGDLGKEGNRHRLGGSRMIRCR
jgi:hypothetical protein